MREKFVEKRFYSGSRSIIDTANAIIRDYRLQGFTLTVRQLYYQFVARDIIANKQSEYKRLASIINDARLAGLIDWSAIEDRTRYLRAIPHYSDVPSFIDKMSGQYAENLWRDQDTYCEVWIEKDALVGVIERVCNEFRVPYYACRGYSSQSEQYLAGKRLRRKIDAGKNVIVFHLGDHDPSGIHMSVDNEQRLQLFAQTSAVELRRIALTMAQIEEHEPPPNPAKETDARFAGYQAQFGDDSWELDALDPAMIESLVRDSIESILDKDAFDDALDRETDHSSQLRAVATKWNDVSAFMNNPDGER